MSQNGLVFEPYDQSHFEGCLALFDRNTPAYFATNERNDYIEYLRSDPAGYQVALAQQKPVAAFGLAGQGDLGRISWIMVCPAAKGQGVGAQMMERAQWSAAEANFKCLSIAASHLSAPFFARFGAEEIKFIPDGWGAGMHRVDMELRISQ